MHPQVTIIIPAFNTEQHIAQAIDSALGQDGCEFEIIVVDDASTDGTAGIVRSIGDERLRLFQNERNAGPGYSRNRALREARGDWIALLDSDDWYAPGRLQALVTIAEAENADLVADDLYLIGSNRGNPPPTHFSRSAGLPGKRELAEPQWIDIADFIGANMPGSNWPGLGATKPVMRRSFLTGRNIEYDEALRFGEDFCLFLECLLKGARFMVVAQPYYYYRSRRGSLSAEAATNFPQFRHAALALLQHASGQNDPSLTRALTERLSAIGQRVTYHRITDLLRARAFPAALLAIIRNPGYLGRRLASIRSAIRRRILKPKNT